MAIADEIEAEFATDIMVLERTLAFQWGIATGAVHADANVSTSDTRKIISTFKAAVIAGARKSAAVIKRIVCDNLEYCKNKNTTKVQAVVALLDAKVILLTGLPMPMIKVTCYAVKIGVLDDLCGCRDARPKVAVRRRNIRRKIKS